MHSESESESQLFEIEVFFFFSFLPPLCLRLVYIRQDDLTMLLKGCHRFSPFKDTVYFIFILMNTWTVVGH